VTILTRVLRDFYDKYWRQRKAKGYIYSKELKPNRFSIIVSLIGSGKKVLDVGCGEGFLSKLLTEMGNEIIGIDISEIAVKLAKEKGIKAFVCDIENESLPFNDVFDVIVLSEVLEHLVSPKKVIYKLKRHLKNDGVFVLTFPNIAYYKYRLQLLLGRFPKQYLYDPSEHLHYWSIPDFKNFLISCGLECVDVKVDFSFPFHAIISKIKPLRILLENFPNLFGYQIIGIARKKKY